MNDTKAKEHLSNEEQIERLKGIQAMLSDLHDQLLDTQNDINCLYEEKWAYLHSLPKHQHVHSLTMDTINFGNSTTRAITEIKEATNHIKAALDNLKEITGE